MNYADVPGLTSVPLLQTLVELAAAVPADQAVVEIGVFRGRSLCALGAGAAGGAGAHVWGVDPWDLPGQRTTLRGATRLAGRYMQPATRRAARRHVRACGLAERVSLVRGFSAEVAAGWEGPLVGLLHVDGDHRQAGRDAEAWWPHLAAGAVIAFDDHQYASVAADVAALVASGRTTAVDVRHGRLAVLRRLP